MVYPVLKGTNLTSHLQGKYLQDHPEGIIRMNSSVPLGDNPMDDCRPDLGAEDPCLIQWNTTGTGPYGEGAAYLSVRYRTSTSENEDIDIWMWGFGGCTYPIPPADFG